jgi:hypothetical protein
MNAKIASAAIAALLGVTGAAYASDLYVLTPAQTSFSGSGEATITIPLGQVSCQLSATGTTSKTVGQITGVTFSGSDFCDALVAMSLPWKVRALSYTNIQITHAAVGVPGVGRCGPNQLKGGLSQGTITIADHLTSALGVCDINATISTAPSLGIQGAPPPP